MLRKRSHERRRSAADEPTSTTPHEHGHFEDLRSDKSKSEAIWTFLSGIDGIDDMLAQALLAKAHAAEPITATIADEMARQARAKHKLSPLFTGMLLMEGDLGDGELQAANGDDYIDVEFEVALDSGCTDNVCHPGDIPGYSVQSSAGSRRGQNFTVGDGNKISNDGEVHLNLQADLGDAHSDIKSTFQVANVCRPLMSVGRVCDNDHEVIFGKTRARIVAKSGETICTFEREPGGLYLAKFRLKRPLPFQRQGS